MNTFKAKYGLFIVSGIISIAHLTSLPRVANGKSTQFLTSINFQNNSPKSILDHVYTQYKKSNFVKVDFSTSYASVGSNSQTRDEKGTLWLVQDKNQYKINLGSQDYISDGLSQWIILKDAKEVQITEVSEQTGQISPANMFSFFQKGFKQNLIESQNIAGKNLWVIDLIPEKKNQAYEKITLRISKSDYQIFDIQVLDKNKNRLTYKIQKLQTVSNLDPSTFKFNTKEYVGYEIVDLR